MGLVNKFIDEISKIEQLVKFKPFELHLGSQGGNYGNEEEILENIIRGKSRLTESSPATKIFIQLYSKEISRYIFTAILQEFPSCCGKLIIHSIRFTNLLYTKNSSIFLSSETGCFVFTNVLELIKDISEVLGYSSVDFIVSDKEQPFLLSSVRDAGLKEASSFKNRRNEYSHTCYTFSVNFPEIIDSKKTMAEFRVEAVAQ